jgi:hypothetical protein
MLSHLQSRTTVIDMQFIASCQQRQSYEKPCHASIGGNNEMMYLPSDVQRVACYDNLAAIRNSAV